MKQKHCGFTLIELVIATALAALLMLGVLTILTGITRDRERLSASHSLQDDSRTVLAEVFRRDLSCSTEFSVLADGSIQVRSLQAIDDKTLEPTDRPSLITYRISDKDGLGLLLRDQQMQDDPVQPPALRSLLACHVRQFDIERLPDPADLSAAANSKTITDSAKSQTVPNRVRLKIIFDDSSDAIDQIICLR